jgi:hypothetical protein
MFSKASAPATGCEEKEKKRFIRFSIFRRNFRRHLKKMKSEKTETVEPERKTSFLVTVYTTYVRISHSVTKKI